MKKILVISLLCLSPLVLAQDRGHDDSMRHDRMERQERQHNNQFENRNDRGNNNYRRPQHMETQHWRGNFHQDDNRMWNQGRWARTSHDGKLGWWWIVGSQWYLYNQPVYPYPVMSVPPVIYNSYHNKRIPHNVRYYCATSRSYYPYVTYCSGSWKAMR